MHGLTLFKLGHLAEPLKNNKLATCSGMLGHPHPQISLSYLCSAFITRRVF